MYVHDNSDLLHDDKGVHFENFPFGYTGRKFDKSGELEQQKLYNRPESKQIIREVVDESLLPYNYNNDYDELELF